MAKRGPTSELNHDNWNEEEEEEERGEFAQAPKEELQNRVIKVAKRRSLNPSGGSPANSPFSGFKGFQAKPATPNFDFVLGGMKNGHENKSNVESKKDETKSITFTGGAGASLRQSKPDPPKQPQPSSVVTVKSNPVKEPVSKHSPPDYYAHLKSLNLAVSAWITKHLNDNPYCILSPVFRDYDKHLENINKFKPATSSESDDSLGGSDAMNEGKNERVLTKTSNPLDNTPKAADSGNKSESEKEVAEFKGTEALFKKPDSLSSGSSGSIKLVQLSDTPSSNASSFSGSVVASPASTITLDSNKSPNTTADVTPPSSFAPCVNLEPATPDTAFSTPVAQTPATTNTLESSFQTPALSTSSVFGNFTSKNIFGGSAATTTQTSSLTFSFGSTSTNAPTNNPSLFSFGSGGLQASSTPSTFSMASSTSFSLGGAGSGFSSGTIASGGMSFGSLAAKAAERSEQQASAEDNESEEPPKVEFNPIQEEGSVYEVLCKMYLKKDGSYVDKGKGMLYIKNSDGVSQLLIRAATTLGQVMLNVRLSAAVTLSRPTNSKTNVIVMCVVTQGEPPTPVLLRVKSEEVANELYAKLEENKK